MNTFVFPGQGAQFKGMIQDLCAENLKLMDLLNYLGEIAGFPIYKLLWHTEIEDLSRSDKSQLAITSVSLILTEALKQKGIVSDICAGFSLGEFPALCDAGVLSLEDTIRIVQKRGNIMQKVCDNLAQESNGNPSGMAAVIGLPSEKIIEVLAPLTQSGIAFAANLNSPKQTVISGTAEGLTQAENLLKEAGARRVIRLKVAGPFHSPLMNKASEEFSKELDSISFKNPNKILLSNVSGKQVTTGEEAKKLAVFHLTNPVQWVNEEKIISLFFEKSENNKMFEVGPGNVLSNLWRDSGFAENIQCVPCGTLEQYNAIEQ